MKNSWKLRYYKPIEDVIYDEGIAVAIENGEAIPTALHGRFDGIVKGINNDGKVEVYMPIRPKNGTKPIFNVGKGTFTETDMCFVINV